MTKDGEVGGWSTTTERHDKGAGFILYPHNRSPVFVPLRSAVHLQNSIRLARKRFWKEKIDLRKRPHRLVKQRAK